MTELGIRPSSAAVQSDIVVARRKRTKLGRISRAGCVCVRRFKLQELEDDQGKSFQRFEEPLPECKEAGRVVGHVLAAWAEPGAAADRGRDSGSGSS